MINRNSNIKYLFIVGDIVSGVGVHPNQLKDLKIEDIEEQYQNIAELLGKIRKDIIDTRMKWKCMVAPICSASLTTKVHRHLKSWTSRRPRPNR